MVKKFTCVACEHKCRGGAFAVTAQNLAAVLLLFSAAGRSGAENIKEGALLCSKSRQWRGQNGKADPTWLPPCCSEAEQASLVDLLVGQGVSKVFADHDESGTQVTDRNTSPQPHVPPGVPGGAA